MTALESATLTVTRYGSIADFVADADGTVLARVEEGTHLDELRDAGSGHLVIHNDAPLLPVIGDYLAWDLDDGSGPVRIGCTTLDVPGATRDRVDVDPDEEQAERTTVTGPNHLGVWTKGRIGPPGGVDRFPEADTIGWDYTHPGYTMPAAWVTPANVITDWGTMHDAWAFITGGAFDIAPNFHYRPTPLVSPQVGTLTSAPEGDWYFRGYASFPITGYYTVEITSDDSAEMWVDGIPFLTNNGWAESAARTEFFTAGSYWVTGHVHNFAPPGWFGGQNPSYVGVACFAGGGQYQSTTPVWTSSSSWYTDDYPPDIPGMTVGEALLLMRQQQIDRGAAWASAMNPTFDAVNDTNNSPWPVIHNMTATCGRDSCLDFQKKIMSYAADIAMSPDSFDWNAYIFGTLNPNSGVRLARGANLTHLSYHEDATVADEALTRSDALGWHREGSGETEGYLEIGSERAPSEVVAISTQVVTDYGRTRKAAAASYVARRGQSPSELPYVNPNFVKGSDITFPDEDGSPLVDRNLSITLTFSENNEGVGVALNIKDYLADEFERILQDLRS